MKNNQDGQFKTALITGATSGIGYELSKLFAQKGYNLVLVARNKQRLLNQASQLEKSFSVTVKIIARDLAEAASPGEIFAELQANSIHIDILVNNAGFNEYGNIYETDLQKELQMIQVNMVALTCLTKLLLPGMLEKKYGKILNVGSTGSFAPGPLNAVYCASKAYVLSFSEAIAEELRGTGVTVTALCPGATKTEFARRANMEDVKIFRGRLMDAGKVAEIGYRSLMSGKTSVVAGMANCLMIFSLRFTPRNMVAKVSRCMLSRR